MKWQRYIVRLCLCVAGLLCTVPAFAQSTQWRTIAPGIAYTTIHIDPTSSTSLVHAFRIDTRRYAFDIALAKDYGIKSASVRELGQRAKAIIAINGGFFSPEYEPLGLRIQQGQERSKIKPISWWGVFYLQNGKPRIVAQRDFRVQRNIAMAVQSGPRLVVSNIIPRLKDGDAARSGIGVTPQGEMVIAVTHNARITTRRFAEIFRAPAAVGGLGCRDALNLDGGRSAQLYARIGTFQINIPNLSAITDAVVVKAQ